MGFICQSSLKNKQKWGFTLRQAHGAMRMRQQGMLSHGTGAHGTCVGAHEAAPQVRFLVYSSRFQLFFRLETPRNLK